MWNEMNWLKTEFGLRDEPPSSTKAGNFLINKITVNLSRRTLTKEAG
jgi:hypothetical protein